MKQVTQLLLISLLVIYSTAVSAQGCSKGIEAAITTASVKITDIKDPVLSAMKGDGITGYEGGLFLKFSIAMLYVKPKVLFHYEEGAVNYTLNETEQSSTFSTGKILVPVLIGVKFLPPVLGIEAGPMFNYAVFTTKNFEGQKVDIAKSGIGYRIGLSADLSVLNLTVSYQGVKNNGSSTNIASYQSPDALVFGLGLKF